MEQSDSQIAGNVQKTTPEKKQRKTWAVIVSIILVIVLISVAAILYVKLYKIPHDEAVRQYNEAVDNYNRAVDQFGSASAALEERNKALDTCIAELGQIVYADNLPLDEFLLAEADSVLMEARNVTRDAAPALSGMPQSTDEINREAERIVAWIPDIEAMGDYGDTIDLLAATTEKYQKMVDEFQNCKTDVIWTGIDEKYTLLRFVAKISNDNAYAMRDVVTEWIAYDKNDAIVGSLRSARADIPANSSICYVGGAGSAKLSGTPARVEVRVASEGVLTSRTLPQISVSNVQIMNRGWGSFDVTADCMTDSDILTANLNGQIIVKDADGQIIDADFWSADNLPETIPANGKFVLSEYIYDLPAVPADAEVYMYYVWQ